MKNLRNITPIFLNSLRFKPNTKNRIKYCQFLKTELPQRLTNRINDLNNLPYNLSSNNNVKKVQNLYLNSLNSIINHTNTYNSANVNSFINCLKNIKENHNNVKDDIGVAIKQTKIYNTNQEETINNILDKFYTSRISIRVLISHAIELQRNSSIINSNCRPYYVFQQVINNLNYITNCLYGITLDYQYFGNVEKKITYLESHLYYILFEILKNAATASIIKDVEDPIKVFVSYGKEDIIIKISDKAGGFDRCKIKKMFSYCYSDFKSDQVYDFNQHNTLFGYGYGMPLSRVYAKYLGGELHVLPFEGYGTDVFIYLNRVGNSYENII